MLKLTVVFVELISIIPYEEIGCAWYTPFASLTFHALAKSLSAFALSVASAIYATVVNVPPVTVLLFAHWFSKYLVCTSPAG